MSGINNYFSNNNIFNGTEIPTQGKFDVGDIIVNIGENAEEEPMWMCIEAGEPGVWKVVGKVEDIDLSGYQEKTDENLVTESKDLVGAINELFQSANNGKQLIANAIGEPVSADDTFSAMSNDINGLLATFKTNMMNNGVTVESSDRFKSLIDKIATMVEEGEGKGIQFVSGEHVLTEVLYTNNTTTTININLDFNPNYMIVYIPNLTSLNVGYSNQPDVVLTTDCKSMEIAAWYGSEYEYRGPKFNLSYNQDTITIYIARGATGYSLQIPKGTAIKWYAIGVGEEDATLRDSLASILQEEGVSVTEEDDMASLITKTDIEFDRKKQLLIDALTNKGIDVDNESSYDELLNYINNIKIITKGTDLVAVTGPSLYSNDGSNKTGNLTVSNLPEDAMISSVFFSYSAYGPSSFDPRTNAGYIKQYRNGELLTTLVSSLTLNSNGNTTTMTLTDIKNGDVIEYCIKGYTEKYDDYDYYYAQRYFNNPKITYNLIEF